MNVWVNEALAETYLDRREYNSQDMQGQEL